MEYKKKEERRKPKACNQYSSAKIPVQAATGRPKGPMDIQQSAHTEKPSLALNHAIGHTVFKYECCIMCAFKLKVRKD